MTMRRILEIAIQIIGVYLILTAIPVFFGALITSFIAAFDIGFLEVAKAFISGILGTIFQFFVGLWAALSAESISRAFRPDDD